MTDPKMLEAARAACPFKNVTPHCNCKTCEAMAAFASEQVRERTREVIEDRRLALNKVVGLEQQIEQLCGDVKAIQRDYSAAAKAIRLRFKEDGIKGDADLRLLEFAEQNGIVKAVNVKEG